MDTERDVTRIVQSWLRADEHESVDRVLDDVLALLDTTPQRRSLRLAPRSADMNTFAKLAIAAAAVVVVAIVGINLLPASGGIGGPAVSPSPTPSPTSTPLPSPSPTPVAAGFPAVGAVAIGRHTITLAGTRASINVTTSDWISNGSFGIDKSSGVSAEGAGFIFWSSETPIGVFADPCKALKGPPVGASAAALATAVANVPGTDLVSGPSSVTVGGHPAKRVVLTVREDVGCTAPLFMLWYAPSTELARFATQLGSTIRVWIVDVDGKLVWIDGETFKGAGPGPGQQIQQIVDSIRFE